MINTWSDYKEYRKADIIVNERRTNQKDNLLLEHSYYINRYLHLLRLDEYFTNRKSILVIL